MGTHLIDHSDQSDSSFWVKYLCGQYWPKGGSIVQGWGKHGRVGETRAGGGGGGVRVGKVTTESTLMGLNINCHFHTNLSNKSGNDCS